MFFRCDRWDPAPLVLGAKHISNPEVAPFFINKGCLTGRDPKRRSTLSWRPENQL